MPLLATVFFKTIFLGSNFPGLLRLIFYIGHFLLVFDWDLSCRISDSVRLLLDAAMFFFLHFCSWIAIVFLSHFYSPPWGGLFEVRGKSAEIQVNVSKLTGAPRFFTFIHHSEIFKVIPCFFSTRPEVRSRIFFLYNEIDRKIILWLMPLNTVQLWRICLSSNHRPLHDPSLCTVYYPPHCAFGTPSIAQGVFREGRWH